MIAEASRGHEQAAQKRLALLDGIALLRVSDEVATLAQALVDRHAIPEVANADAVHVAVAAVNGIHYLNDLELQAHRQRRALRCDCRCMLGK